MRVVALEEHFTVPDLVQRIDPNLHTRKSLRPFVPFLEVAQALQIAGSVSSPEDAAQATNDWRPQRGSSTHAPSLTTKKAY